MSQELNWRDRAIRAAFVALAVGLGWGIRGDFGHQLGAMVPGALLAMAFAYVSGQDKLLRMMPALAFVGAITMSLGGTMSYGTLHGYAKSSSFVNYTYGYFTLFLCGGVWGGPCGAGLGLLLENEQVRLREWAGAVVQTMVFGFLTHAVIVNMFGFHINPPRSDISIAFFGGMAGLFVWLYRHEKWMGLKGAVYGFIGFGISMSLSRLLGNASHIIPFIKDNWKVMEIGCGMIGGFLMAYALLGKEYKGGGLRPWAAGASYVGLFFVMLGIPLLHWIQRMPREDTVKKVGETLVSLTPEQQVAWVDRLQGAMLVLQIVAAVCAFMWLALHFKGKGRVMAFPILSFGLILLITSNIRSVYPFMPKNAGGFQTQSFFWVLYVSMVLFVLFWRRRPGLVPDAEAESIGLGKAAFATLMLFVLMLILNAPINPLAEKYGKGAPNASANKRFPISSYGD